MTVEEVRPTLEVLDGLDVDAYLLFFPEGEGPPRGVAGLVDWRLCGQLSRTMARGFFRGRAGEKLLAPIHGRLPARRLFGVGSGPRKALDAVRFREIAELGLKTVGAAKVQSVALALPGDPDPPVRSDAARRVVAEVAEHHYRGRLILLPPAP